MGVSFYPLVDATVTILLSSGLALGILLIRLSGGFTLDVFSFLFGSIMLVSVEDTRLRYW
jgi:zinc transport system permease protein